MKVDVILSKKGDHYLAQVSNLPGIRVKEASREAELKGVAQRLQNYFAQVELVRLDLDETQTDSPLLEQFGSFSDDLTFDDWLEGQARLGITRVEVDLGHGRPIVTFPFGQSQG